MLKDLQKVMQEKHMKAYRDLNFPRSLWLKKKCFPLEELFMEPTLKEKNRRGEETGEIKKEEIFNKTDNKTPRRILIEGHAGYGKTTLIAKLAFDWSIGEKYLKEKFDLVFMIPLRYYGGELRNHFLQQIEGVQNSKEEKLKEIKKLEERVLLLLDELDECNERFKESILSLIKGDLYPKMTVILTCRKNLIDDDSVLKSTATLGFDRRFQISGIPPNRRFEFLEKYLNIDNQKLKAKLFQSNVELNDFYECPMFLSLLTVLMQEDRVLFIETKTELYKAVFNFIINRRLEGIFEEIKEIDVFDLEKDEPSACQRFLINFGQLCLEKVKNQSLKFEESELLECSGEDDTIVKIGFVSKIISIYNYDEKEYYETIHRSFLEFLAAFYLSTLDDTEMEHDIQELLSKLNKWPKADQFLYPFLGGFLQFDAFKLFQAFSPYKSVVSVFNKGNSLLPDKYLYSVEDILLEIPKTGTILESLNNLSFGNWENTKYKEFFRYWYIGLVKNHHQFQIISNEISLILPEHLEFINGLLENIKINRIYLEIKDFELEQWTIRINKKKIYCRNLIVNFCKGIPRDFVLILQDLFWRVKPEKIWLRIAYSHLNNAEPPSEEIISREETDFENFCRELSGDDLQNFFIHYLSIDDIPVHFFKVIYYHIQFLVEKKKLAYGVNIIFNDSINTELNTLVNFVCKSHLKSFCLCQLSNDDLSFPFQFFNNGKHWKFLSLNGLFNGKNGAAKLKSVSVEHFHCKNLSVKKNKSLVKSKDLTIKLLLKCQDIKTITCDWKLMSEIGSVDLFSRWKGFETVLRLNLSLCSTNDELKSFKGICRFKNIREIHLNCGGQREFLADLVLRLPSLRKVSVDDGYLTLEFLERLLTLKNKKQIISLDEVEFLGLDWNSSSTAILERLEKCFCEGFFLKVSFSKMSGAKIHELIVHFLSKEDFTISSEWIEEFPEDTMNISFALPYLRHKSSITYRYY